MPSSMRSVWVTKCASSRATGRNARPPAQNAGTHRCLPGLHGQNISHAGFLRTPRTRSGERYLHGRRHPGPGVYESSRNPRLSLGCRVRGDRSLALRFGVRGRARLRARHHRTGTPRQGRLGPRFPGHAQLEYRRVAVKPKSNERGCLKLLDSPFFIFQKQQELTTIEPSSSGKQFP